MAFPVLPPKYYLTHFFEFIDFLEGHYDSVMDLEHREFIRDFRALSENAQCVYVRMINRKGRIFRHQVFAKYKEIENTAQALTELSSTGFTGPLTSTHKKDLLEHLTKPELRKWLKSHGITTLVAASRSELVEIGLGVLYTLDVTRFERASECLTQLRAEEMDYLFFLYFGKIQDSLTLYTLRDLGIRQSGTFKEKFKPRFSSRHDAKSNYFLSSALERIEQTETTEELLKTVVQADQLRDLSYNSRVLRSELMFRTANRLIAENEIDKGLELHLASLHPEAREAAARLLHKLDRKLECQTLLEEIIAEPLSEVELHFAEDFLARKFKKKKTGTLTELLRAAPELVLSDFYLKRAEDGVCAHYQKLGYQAQFTENDLWLSLFGVVFWKELFENENAAIHNPFERGPVDLVSPEFYEKNRECIEEKLLLLQSNKAKIKSLILKCITENYGRLNDVFRWHTSITESLLGFIDKITTQNLAHVLRAMAKRFENYHSGFPDLMLFKDGELRFIEVKAEGDAVRSGQLATMRLLQDAGFSVEVLRIRWQTDPNQIYVVVDVETTGGSSSTHRVTEIGAVKVQNGEVIDEFQTLINPCRPIPGYITQLTGISNEMVADAPVFSDIAAKFLEFMDGAVFVAHNVRFDYGFIQREFSRAGHAFTRPLLCTCSGMRKAYPGIKSYGLKNLSEHFGIDLQTHHRALSDAKAAAQLLLMMNESRS